MLVYYLVLHVLIAWSGHAAWLLRLPSVIATALTGGLVVLLAQRLFPRQARGPSPRPAAGGPVRPAVACAVPTAAASRSPLAC